MICMYIYIYIYMYICIFIHILTHVHDTDTKMHAHTLTKNHTSTHKHTCTNTHDHMHEPRGTNRTPHNYVYWAKCNHTYLTCISIMRYAHVFDCVYAFKCVLLNQQHHTDMYITPVYINIHVYICENMSIHLNICV